MKQGESGMLFNVRAIAHELRKPFIYTNNGIVRILQVRQGT